MSSSLEGPLDNLTGDAPIASDSTALRLPDELALETWRTIGERISHITNASSWWLGDWLVFGQERYPDRYQRAMDSTLLDYQTLRNYAWIARRFGPGRRRASLSFQHHVEVAALPVDEQEHWLNFAEKFTWSRNELRRQLRASTQVDQPTTAPQEIQLQLRVARERIERWEAAASKVGTELTDWIAITLEEAARRPRPVVPKS